MATSETFSEEEVRRRKAALLRVGALPVKTERGRRLLELRKELVSNPEESMTLDEIAEQIAEARS